MRMRNAKDAHILHVLACKKAARRNNTKPRPQQKAGKSHSRTRYVTPAQIAIREVHAKKTSPSVQQKRVRESQLKKTGRARSSRAQSEWEREGRDWRRCYLPLNLAITLAARCTNGRAAKINYPLRASDVAFNFCAYFYNKRRAPAWYNYCPSGRCYWWLVRKIKPLNNNNKTESVYGRRCRRPLLRRCVLGGTAPRMKNQSQSISNFLLCLFSFSSSNQNIKASLSSFYIKPAAAAFSCDSLITDWLTWESMCVLLVLSYLHTYEYSIYACTRAQTLEQHATQRNYFNNKKNTLRRAPFMCIVLHCPVDEGKNSAASPAAVRVCMRRVFFQKPREAFWHHLQQSCDFCHSCMWRRVIHDCAGVLFHIWILFLTNFLRVEMGQLKWETTTWKRKKMDSLRYSNFCFLVEKILYMVIFHYYHI